MQRPTPSAPRRGAKRAPGNTPDFEQHARELMTMAAHDLRSPLASMRFMAHYTVQRWRAGKKPPCDEWASVVVGMCAAVEDALSMIDDLLTIERVEQRGGRAPLPAVLDIRAVIDLAIDREKLALERAGCDVTVRQNALTSIRGPWDRAYLLRVFRNLLRNAVGHAAGAPILITLARRGDRLGIVFADRGPDLPGCGRPGRAASEAPDRVRMEAAHGLGLWIVRRAVNRLGGRLRIQDHPDEGFAFDIELPGLIAPPRTPAGSGSARVDRRRGSPA
jgi:two-component system OmpR family sensor kinase